MVEEVLKKSTRLLTREQIKKKLKTQIMHQTLNVILEYLERSGKIIDGRKGILWTYNPSPKLEKAIWLCEVLEEQEGIILNWRVLKKYSEDYDDRKK